MYRVKQTIASILLAFRYGLFRLTSNHERGISRSDIVVSLTTHGERVNKVSKTLKSLVVQRHYRLKVFLFISSADFQRSRRELLKFDQSRISVRIVEEDLQVYNKVFQISNDFANQRIITVDDDIIYKRDLFKTLIEASDSAPEVIWGTRGRMFSNDAPYGSFRIIKGRKGIIKDLFLTGVGGIIYPAGFLVRANVASKAYLNICPTNDDVWLHFFAKAEGIQSGLASEYTNLIESPAAKKHGLWRKNNQEGKNDEAILNARAYFGF